MHSVLRANRHKESGSSGTEKRCLVLGAGLVSEPLIEFLHRDPSLSITLGNLHINLPYISLICINHFQKNSKLSIPNLWAASGKSSLPFASQHVFEVLYFFKYPWKHSVGSNETEAETVAFHKEVNYIPQQRVHVMLSIHPQVLSKWKDKKVDSHDFWQEGNRLLRILPSPITSENFQTMPSP